MTGGFGSGLGFRVWFQGLGFRFEHLLYTSQAQVCCTLCTLCVCTCGFGKSGGTGPERVTSTNKKIAMRVGLVEIFYFEA